MYAINFAGPAYLGNLVASTFSQVSMRLAHILASRANTKVLSIFRNAAHSDEVAVTGATPLVLSLEDEPKQKFTEVFEGKDVVYFSAGAGGKGGAERTRKVDYDGALKIFDAIEGVKGEKPRLIMVSAIDVRDRSKVPAHYVRDAEHIDNRSLSYPAPHQTEEDLKHSENVWKAIGTYMQAKYDADKNLATRTAFKWTILRPGRLTHEPGVGKASVGKAPLSTAISVSWPLRTWRYMLMNCVARRRCADVGTPG